MLARILNVYERRSNTGNGNQVNLLKLVWRKTREITSGELIFGVFLVILNM